MTVIPISAMLQAEHDENVVRLNFAPSEIYAITEALRPKVEAEAVERISPGTNQHTKEVSTNFVETSADKSTRETNAILAKKVGVSREQLRKTKEVVEAAAAEPEKYGDLQKRMDDTRKVD